MAKITVLSPRVIKYSCKDNGVNSCVVSGCAKKNVKEYLRDLVGRIICIIYINSNEHIKYYTHISCTNRHISMEAQMLIDAKFLFLSSIICLQNCFSSLLVLSSESMLFHEHYYAQGSGEILFLKILFFNFFLHPHVLMAYIENI